MKSKATILNKLLENKWEGHLDNFILNVGTKRFINLEGDSLVSAARVGNDQVSFAFKPNQHMLLNSTLKAIVDGDGHLTFGKRIEVLFPCKFKK